MRANLEEGKHNGDNANSDVAGLDLLDQQRLAHHQVGVGQLDGVRARLTSQTRQAGSVDHARGASEVVDLMRHQHTHTPVVKIVRTETNE